MEHMLQGTQLPLETILLWRDYVSRKFFPLMVLALSPTIRRISSLQNHCSSYNRKGTLPLDPRAELQNMYSYNGQTYSCLSPVHPLDQRRMHKILLLCSIQMELDIIQEIYFLCNPVIRLRYNHLHSFLSVLSAVQDPISSRHI